MYSAMWKTARGAREPRLSASMTRRIKTIGTVTAVSRFFRCNKRRPLRIDSHRRASRSRRPYMTRRRVSGVRGEGHRGGGGRALSLCGIFSCMSWSGCALLMCRDNARSHRSLILSPEDGQSRHFWTGRRAQERVNRRARIMGSQRCLELLNLSLGLACIVITHAVRFGHCARWLTFDRSSAKSI
jgi:hypothetical protein